MGGFVRRVRYPITTATLALVVGALLAGWIGPSVSAQGGPPSLECPSGDQIFVTDRHLRPDVVGAPTTADQAVDQFLAQHYPDMRGHFGHASGNEASADADSSNNGKRQATAHAERVGDGWGITHFEACNSSLGRPAQGPGGR